MKVRDASLAGITVTATVFCLAAGGALGICAPVFAQSAAAAPAAAERAASTPSGASPATERAASTPSAASPATAAPADMPRPARLPGYLGRDGIPDHRVFLPAPPADDSALGAADAAVFQATRALQDTPRWRLAAEDAEIGGRKMVGDFACALGVDLTEIETPALSRVLARASADLGPIIGASKAHYNRPRPFLAHEGPVCVAYSEEFRASGSYPSGHSATGWMHALLLAEVASDNTAEILARGRAYGESRVVCGVHYVTDVEGGRLSATALVAALHGNSQFEADIAAARAEIAAIRARQNAARTDAASCAAEEAALHTPW